MDEPRIIKGGVAVDDRGRVTFCNDFDMSDVKRFYMLENHQEGYIRAWHGHLREAKWVTAVSGVAVVATAKMYDPQVLHGSDVIFREEVVKGKSLNKEVWPNNIYDISRHILHPNGDVLYIPPGYANGHMNLVTGTRVLHFSDTVSYTHLTLPTTPYV